MTTYFGRLTFTGWLHEFKLGGVPAVEIDMWPVVKAALAAMDTRPVDHRRTRDQYVLKVDPASKFVMQYRNRPDCNPIMVAKDIFGFSNVGLYLEEACQWMNGRQVQIEITEDMIDIRAPLEDAHLDLYFTAGNSCAVPDDALKDICMAGLEGCCIFLTCNGDGFQCEKFNGGLARILLDRFARGEMQADRIGNCRCVGRKEKAA